MSVHYNRATFTELYSLVMSIFIVKEQIAMYSHYDLWHSVSAARLGPDFELRMRLRRNTPDGRAWWQWQRRPRSP